MRTFEEALARYTPEEQARFRALMREQREEMRRLIAPAPDAREHPKSCPWFWRCPNPACTACDPTPCNCQRTARGESGDVRALRERLGYTQADFERLLGVGPKTVVRWERGTVEPNQSVHTLLRLVGEVPGVAERLAAWHGVSAPAVRQEAIARDAVEASRPQAQDYPDPRTREGVAVRRAALEATFDECAPASGAAGERAVFACVDCGAGPFVGEAALAQHKYDRHFAPSPTPSPAKGASPAPQAGGAEADALDDVIAECRRDESLEPLIQFARALTRRAETAEKEQADVERIVLGLVDREFARSQAARRERDEAQQREAAERERREGAERALREARSALLTAHAALRVSVPGSEDGYSGRCRQKARAAIEAITPPLWEGAALADGADTPIPTQDPNS